jgi:polysaccharide deacetylase family protein (PEP-CTERM system associated)
MSATPQNMMTVDVEDWFHILDADEAPDRPRWDALESRVEANTDRLLQLFADRGARATFFVVGWVAWRHPELVRRIAAAGHELGSHSFWHEILHRHDRDSLARDLEASKKLLEDLAGAPVRGFRAPGASVTEATAWAFDTIVEQGFAYDASLCPGLSSHGGYPSPFAGPHRVRCQAGELIEIPSSTLDVAGRRIPYAGGGYLRLFPYSLIRRGILRDNRAGRPTNIYLHPREIDPGQPRMELPAKRRFKYYVGLSGAEQKVARLLRDFSFSGCWEWIERHGDALDGVLDVRATAQGHPPTPDPARVPPPPPALVAAAS